MRSPDVAFLLHSFADGGTERVAVDLANEFVSRGLIVDVVVESASGPFRDDLDERATVVELGRSALLLPVRVWRYQRQSKPNSVLSFLLGFNLVSALVRVPAQTRCLVLTEHSPVHIPEPRPLWKRILLRYLPVLYANADAVVAVSDGVAAELTALGVPESRVHSIPNPARANREALDQLPDVDHPYFHSGEGLLLAAGRLVPSKDYETLLRAVRRVREFEPVRLLILGEGPELRRLKRLRGQLGLDEYVDFVGFRNPPWGWMARADVVVSSSRFEGWGNVLAESLALGVPVVSTDCPTGPRQILEDGRWGSLVPVGDVEGLAAAIGRELHLGRDPSKLRARAAEWTIERIADQYMKVLGIVPPYEHGGSTGDLQ